MLLGGMGWFFSTWIIFSSSSWSGVWLALDVGVMGLCVYLSENSLV